MSPAMYNAPCAATATTVVVSYTSTASTACQFTACGLACNHTQSWPFDEEQTITTNGTNHSDAAPPMPMNRAERRAAGIRGPAGWEEPRAVRSSRRLAPKHFLTKRQLHRREPRIELVRDE